MQSFSDSDSTAHSDTALASRKRYASRAAQVVPAVQKKKPMTIVVSNASDDRPAHTALETAPSAAGATSDAAPSTVFADVTQYGRLVAGSKQRPVLSQPKKTPEEALAENGALDMPFFVPSEDSESGSTFTVKFPASRADSRDFPLAEPDAPTAQEAAAEFAASLSLAEPTAADALLEEDSVAHEEPAASESSPNAPAATAVEAPAPATAAAASAPKAESAPAAAANTPDVQKAPAPATAAAASAPNAESAPAAAASAPDVQKAHTPAPAATAAKPDTAGRAETVAHAAKAYAEAVDELLSMPFFVSTDASESARTLTVDMAPPAPAHEQKKESPAQVTRVQSFVDAAQSKSAYDEAAAALQTEPFFAGTAEIPYNIAHTPAPEAAASASQAEPALVAEASAPQAEPASAAVASASQVDTAPATEASAPQAEPASVAEASAPQVDTAPVAEASAPQVDTASVAEASAPQAEPASAAAASASQVDTAPVAEASALQADTAPAAVADEFAEGDSALSEAEGAESGRARRKTHAEKVALRQEKKALKAKMREEARAMRVRRPIGIKLIAIISILVILALGGVTLLVSYFITQDVRTSAEENNLAINTRTAADCENRIVSALSSVDMFIDLLNGTGENETEIKSVESLFFERNKTVIAIYLPDSARSFYNNTFLVAHEINRGTVDSYFAQEGDVLQKAALGTVSLLNAAPFFNTPLLGLFFPSAGQQAVGVLYATEQLNESFATGTVNQSFFVNNDGIVLVHSDASLMMAGADESANPIVQAIGESATNNRQISYHGADGEYIGAFRKLSIGNGSVITVVKTSIVLEGIRATTRRNIYIMFTILSVAIMAIYFFSKSLSDPLKQLTSVVNEINKGNFNTDLFNGLRTNGKDEIGALIKSTKNEREILNMFSRLTNKGVTKAVITKQIDFEPHLKDITIFFSDIRGFTAISDGFKSRFGEKSAGEIIGFLNDYMSRMVSCIRRTGGIVDKFEGDAIMACWGVLRQEDFAWERADAYGRAVAAQKAAHDEYVREDALSAITSSIAMRYSLLRYNKDAAAFTEAHKDEPAAQYKPQIRMGAGLNSGRATVGFMGSFDKMEFTSIGDAVNLASRTEASNKPCGTDILLTEDTYKLIKDDYIRCAENNFTIRPEFASKEIVVEQIPVEFEVKGKGKQHFYGVVNMPQFDIVAFFSKIEPLFELDADCARAAGPTGPKTLADVRRLLGIPEPNFGQVNLDAEENKIQPASS